MIPNERPTPLTDAVLLNICAHTDIVEICGHTDIVEADFARTIERKLAERTEQRDTCNTAYRLAKENQELLIAQRDTALAKLDKCREALESSVEIVAEYASTHPRFTSLDGNAQDPLGAHAMLVTIRQTLEETK